MFSLADNRASGKESGMKKRKSTGSPADAQREAKSTKTTSDSFLEHCRIHIVQAGIGKARSELFNKQIVNNGGTFESSFCPSVTHLVVDEKMDFERMCRILKIDAPPPNVKVVRSVWLSSCLKDKECVDTGPYRVRPTVPSEKKETSTNPDGETQSESGGTKRRTKQEDDAKPKFPQVGAMPRFSRKPRTELLGPAAEDDGDSDYVPSGDEEEAEGEGGAETSEQATPSSQSLQRKLPVSVVCSILSTLR